MQLSSIDMSQPVLDLNEEDLLSEHPSLSTTHNQPCSSQPGSQLNFSNIQSTAQASAETTSRRERDLVDTFDLFKNYLDRKLIDLKSDLLSEQDNLSKKFRDEASIKLRSEGNRIQFRFNEDILEGLHKLHRQLQINSSSLAPLAGDLVGKLKERNKLIRIADNSAGGWATVKEYESSDIADNEEDEKRIRQAESRALKVIKEKKARPQPYTSRPSTSAIPVPTMPTASVPAQSYNFNRVDQPFRTGAARREPCPYDICHLCKQYGHWRRNCPLNFKNATNPS